MSSLVAVASAVAPCTISFARSSRRLISWIEAESSEAAVAAVSTLSEAAFESCTAPSVRSRLWSDVASSVRAASFIAMALPLTVLSTVSTRARNEAVCASIMARRSSRSRSASRSCSVTSCRVISEWVSTQPPPGIGWQSTEMKRPSPVAVIRVAARPSAICFRRDSI
jgi:hypothetical protein